MARDVLEEFEQTLSEILSQGGDKIAEEWMETSRPSTVMHL